MMTSVAIVEDNNDFRASLSRYLDEAPGYRCACACSTSEEALQKIPRQLPDVVLMDIHLPNMSGVECTRRLKELCPSVQILILTVYEDNERILPLVVPGLSAAARCAPFAALSALLRPTRAGIEQHAAQGQGRKARHP